PLLNPQLFEMVRSFLSERTFKVVQDGTLSSLRPIKGGVPQGSVLGPTLYSLFTHDMPKSTGHDQNSMLATFADDTAVLSRSNCIYDATDMLQLYLKRFENWACRWNIS
ncbi:hypothetical protein KR200_008515, partial [Drosophila serrata]